MSAPIADHDTPVINQTTFGHCMMAAMSSYLDAIAVGNTSTGRAHLSLAKQFSDDSLIAAGNRDELLVAQKFNQGLSLVDMV